MESNVAVIVGAFVTVTGGFFAIAKIMLNQAAKDRDADRAERAALNDAIKEMAVASTKVADATERTAEEAKTRNGHLGDQGVQLAKLVVQGNKTTAKILERLEKTAVIAAEDRPIHIEASEKK